MRAALPAPVFLAPLRLEAAALRRGAPGAEVRRIGMGPARAAAACARLTTEPAAGRALLLAGVAGGLVADLVPGDVVVASSIVGTGDGGAFVLSGAEEVAAALDRAGLAVRLSPIFCSEKILRGTAARQAAAASGATIVEMEARWLSPLAQRHPFAVVRVVLDTLGAEFGSRSTPAAALRALKVLRRCGEALAGFAPAPAVDPLTRSN